MTRKGFAPIGSRGEWPQFASGKRYPYVLWGRTFGEGLGPEKTASELNAQAQRLVSGTVETPSWAEEFEEPFEDFKALSRQENSGLVVVTHGGDTESASFGDATGPAVSAHALTAMGDMLMNEAGVQAASKAPQPGQATV